MTKRDTSDTETVERFGRPCCKHGAQITIPGHRDEPCEVTVAAPCEAADGHWFCVTHQRGLGSNWDAASHVDMESGCVLAWICHLHGPEQP